MSANIFFRNKLKQNFFSKVFFFKHERMRFEIVDRVLLGIPFVVLNSLMKVSSMKK